MTSVQIIVQEKDNNTNGYLVCFKWYLDSIDSSSGIYKSCLDQLTSHILQVILMKIASVQEMIMIDKSYKWFHDNYYK